MKKISFIYILPLLLLLAVAVSVMVIMYSRQDQPRKKVAKAVKQEVQQETLLETIPVTLFFHDPEEELLIPETRNIYATNVLSDRAKQIIMELMRGAAMGGLSTIPQEVTLREIYILEDGTTFVDFSREFEAHAGGGSSSQLMQIYSVVNSLTFNFEEIDKVAILIEGKQKDSFGGHIYSGGFFREKLAVVKFSESEPSPEEKEITAKQIKKKSNLEGSQKHQRESIYL